jgi:osmotically-inducible protein OsmY
VIEEVLRPLNAADVELEVTEGCVRLTGEVSTSGDLSCLRHALSRVPGVVAIECNATSTS